MIKIKEKKIIDFQIHVSTRQPDKIMNELIDILDDDVLINLNNEKIFEESDIIFLCIQAAQLDLLSKEIFPIFNERIEKLIKREYKFYPFLISFLSATTINRLEMFFPRKVHIERTKLLHNFLRSKKKALFNSENTLDGDGEYLDESCDHFLSKDKGVEVIESLIVGLTKQFYSESIIHQRKNMDYKNRKIVEKPIKESPMFLFEVIFGKDLANKYYDMFNYEKQKFLIEGINNDKKNEINEKNNYINNQGDNALEKEEENPEEVKIKQEFFKK